MSESTAKQKDLAFLTALKDLDWEATSEEIRVRTETNPDIVALNNAHISHRRNKRFRGAQNSKPLNDCLVVEAPVEATNGESPPKLVRVKEDQREDVAQFIEGADASVGMFGSHEEAFEDLLTTVDEQKAAIDELEGRIEEQVQMTEQLTAEFSMAMKRVREVVLDEHGIDIREAIDAPERASEVR